MGRSRKADIDAVVQFEEPSYGVIVGYRDTVYSNRYHVVRTDQQGRAPRGPALWLDSPDFTPTGRISRRPGRIVRANERHFGPSELRGCSCQCCPHLAGYEDDPED